MTEDGRTERVIGRAWRDEFPWTFLTRLTEIEDRMGGHAGERRAAALVAEAFAEAGARNVTTTAFDVQRWTRGRTAFGVTDPVERSFEAVALPYSPSGDVAGELVDVGHGTPAEIEAVDVAGKIAVASTTTPPGSRFVHRMEKFGHAAAAGAVGFVFRNHVPGQLPPTGALRFDAEAAVPGVGVSKETGAWLVEYAERGGRAALTVDAATDPGTSQNVTAELGPETERELLLLGHYDAHDVAEGALDNGCGIAVVAQAARLLAALDLPMRVRVAGVGCEELGLMGSEALARRLDLDRLHAVVNVDGAGRFRDLKAFTHTSADAEAAANAVSEATGQPVAVDPDAHPFSDQWPFVRRGVPALQLHSESGERGRGWGHTAADTRDKVDPRNLREHAILAALLVRELAERDVDRLDAAAVAENMRANEFEEGMRAADVWPADWD